MTRRPTTTVVRPPARRGADRLVHERRQGDSREAGPGAKIKVSFDDSVRWKYSASRDAATG